MSHEPEWVKTVEHKVESVWEGISQAMNAEVQQRMQLLGNLASKHL
jgi:hypothetical protein